jgi:hypothetical protein
VVIKTPASQDFAFSVLSIAKEMYGEQARYITKTRAIKLICLVADELEFDGITRGWYNFGEYSFGVDSLIRFYFEQKGTSLLDISLPSIRFSNEGQIRRAIKTLKSHFIMETPKFMEWIHYTIAPDPYKRFYKCHDEFEIALGSLGGTTSQMLLTNHPRDQVGEIITRYNTNLKHLSKERQNLFFDFTDMFEELLLVAKVRKIKLADLAPYLIPMKNLYEKMVYPCLTPFEQTVRGDNRGEELQIFRKITKDYRSNAIFSMKQINAMISNSDLKPRLDEYDIDIIDTAQSMSPEELTYLDGIFKAPNQSPL